MSVPQHESVSRSTSDRLRAMPSVRGTSLITSSAGTPIYVPIIPAPPSTTTVKYAPPPPSHDMRMLRLYSKQDYTRLPRDKWGIPDAGECRADVESEKREDCMSERCEFWSGADLRNTGMSPDVPMMDVILVPGVCFDSKFQRVRPSLA
jgi:hypothetical protein